MSNRTGYCFVSISPVRKEPVDQSEMVTQLLFGELIEILELNEPWARIVTFSDRYEGFIDSKHLHFLSEKEVRRWMEGQSTLESREVEIMSPWGKQRICRGSYITAGAKEFRIGNDLYSFLEEPLENSRRLFDLATDYLNTPYLWGGKSPFGIDCSGFTQIVFRCFGINLPRDAYEQAEHGMETGFADSKEGDLAFFVNKDGKIIHVGIIGPQKTIIHASGHVRIDELRIEGIYKSDEDRISHRLSVIKRF